jgi:hypothetical protein
MALSAWPHVVERRYRGGYRPLEYLPAPVTVPERDQPSCGTGWGFDCSRFGGLASV